jgi:hypothetical protein
MWDPRLLTIIKASTAGRAIALLYLFYGHGDRLERNGVGVAFSTLGESEK